MTIVPWYPQRALHAVLFLWVAVALLAAMAAAAQEGSLPSECGKLVNPHGPFDYRKVTQPERDLVENLHFHAEYKAYLRGDEYAQTYVGRTPTASGFDYTLRAFPNQPLALEAMGRMALRAGKDKPLGARYSADCYFRRAIAFAPDDAIVSALYAAFLGRSGRAEEVDVQARTAVERAPEDANVLIQVAAAYLEVRRFDLAREYAKRAYALGYPLFGLRERLRRLGEWDEPTPSKLVPEVQQQ